MDLLGAQNKRNERWRGDEVKLWAKADIAKHIWKTRGFGGLMIGYAGMQAGSSKNILLQRCNLTVDWKHLETTNLYVGQNQSRC